MGMVSEFKSFAMRGNVVDMAVGVVIAGAFGKIVTSFTNDLLMPPIGLLTGSVDFSDKLITLKAATEDVAAVTLNYGAFINTVIQFLIIAFAIFLLVKGVNEMKKKEEAKPAPPTPTREVELLTEIRDAVRAR